MKTTWPNPSGEDGAAGKPTEPQYCAAVELGADTGGRAPWARTGPPVVPDDEAAEAAEKQLGDEWVADSFIRPVGAAT